MKFALTGTPGVGKTTCSELVRSIKVVHLADLIESSGAVVGNDTRRDTKEVDASRLSKEIAEMDGDLLLEGHLSHLLAVDVAIVLRCSPRVLGERLRSKGWSREKVRENMEAEAVDVILIEAVESVGTVCEIDVTSMPAEDVARAIGEIIAGETQKYPVGNVDWSQEVLSWY
jgi:adenylate kinase